jgi:hypothetical protein
MRPPPLREVSRFRQIGRELLPKGTARSITVEVRNEHGQRVVTATVTLAVDCVDPEPTPPGDNARGRPLQHSN